MSTDRTVIILSPHFPPSNLAGVHRARHLAKHLPAHGWRPIVLCVDEREHEQQLDADLAQLVPQDVAIEKVTAAPARLSRLAGVGDLGIRAFTQLRRRLMDIIARQHVDAVLITGSPFYPMLLAPLVRAKFGIPVVLDFQDPWVSAHGASHPVRSKADLAHRLSRRLEPRALGGATFVTSVSEVQNDQMAGRYAWLDRERMAAIPIGCDPDDFSALRRLGDTSGRQHLAAGLINLSFVGTCMPRSGPLMIAFLEAVAHLRATHPAAMGQVRLNFIGTSNQPNAIDEFRILPLAKAAGLADAVHEVSQRVPYLEALGVLAHSDGLLLIGSDQPHYTASKIYPALMAQRPYLSLLHRSSSAHTILSQTGGGIAVSFCSTAELEACKANIGAALLQLVTAPQTLPPANPAACSSFTARAIAGRFAAVFASIAQDVTDVLPAAPVPFHRSY